MTCHACGRNGAVPGFVACEFCRQAAKVNGHFALPVDLRTRIFGRLRIEGDCWVYEGAKTTGGYPAAVMADGRQERPYAIVLRMQAPKPGPGYEADHTCFTRACCRPEHLRWLTKRANMRTRRVPLLTPEEKRRRRAAYMRRYHARQRAAGKRRTPSGSWVA